MNESIKGIADKLFGANPSAKELTLEEMLQYRTKSREMLKNRIKGDKRKSSEGKVKATTVDTDNPCPMCGLLKWDEFPDGRKYCLECGAVVEIDGTVTSGAIRKEIETKGENNKMIEGELKCEKCGKVQPFSATEKELMEFIKQPHKNCGGKVSFSAVEEKSKDFESKSVTGAEKQNVERETVLEKGKRFEHPKRQKFVCYKCDWGNCSETYSDAIVCLLINIDMKLKKLLERWPQ
jgi:hypothetical protein